MTPLPTEHYREKVDLSACHFCAKVNDIEVHHIVPQRFNGSDARENLVAVCDRCHEKLEALYDKRFYESLGIEDESGERELHFTCKCEKNKQVSAIEHLNGGGKVHLCIDELEDRANSIIQRRRERETELKSLSLTTKQRFDMHDFLDSYELVGLTKEEAAKQIHLHELNNE